VSGAATDISVPIESSDGERISSETSPLRGHVAILPLLKIITRDKKDPFVARIFWRMALHPRVFSLAAQFTLLQRLEIAG